MTQTGVPASDREPDETAEEGTPSFEERFRAAFRRVERRLPGGHALAPADELRSLAQEAGLVGDPEGWDRYGERGAVAALEARVAELLGKPAAALFPSGIMAQQSALRVWADRQGSRRVAIPALSHLLCYEQDGPRVLNGFQYEWLTSGPQVPLAEHLQAIPGRLAAALLELPLRDAGYLLPTWAELVGFAEAAHARDVPLHLDGARIWESQPHLGHPLDEIAALADTVYVSLYKGLGGLAGAVLAGPVDVIDEARSWRKRHGGTLFTMAPFALAGLRGLRELLPRMGEFHDRAVELAAGFESAGLRVHPQPPHANAFVVHVDADADTVNEALLSALGSERVLLLPPFRPGEMPATSWTEFAVGPDTMEWETQEAVEAVRDLLLRPPVSAD